MSEHVQLELVGVMAVKEGGREGWEQEIGYVMGGTGERRLPSEADSSCLLQDRVGRCKQRAGVHKLCEPLIKDLMNET